MKEIVVIVSLLLILAGIVWNYNIGLYGGTNCVVAGIVGIGLASLFRDSPAEEEDESKK